MKKFKKVTPFKTKIKRIIIVAGAIVILFTGSAIYKEYKHMKSIIDNVPLLVKKNESQKITIQSLSKEVATLKQEMKVTVNHQNIKTFATSSEKPKLKEVSSNPFTNPIVDIGVAAVVVDGFIKLISIIPAL